MKKILMGINIAFVLLIINTWAKPGGVYTLTGDEKSIAEIIKSDMKKHPNLYKGESLNSYISKFKEENRIEKKKLSPGDQLQFPETTASLKAKQSTKVGNKETEQYAEVCCKQKSGKFRDGAKVVRDAPFDIKFIDVPPKYKDFKITIPKYGSTDSVEFKVKKAGLVLITFHDGGVPTKKYLSEGWSKIEKIHIYDKSATTQDQYTGRFILLGKYHDVGSYSIGGESFWGGVHLLH